MQRHQDQVSLFDFLVGVRESDTQISPRRVIPTKDPRVTSTKYEATTTFHGEGKTLARQTSSSKVLARQLAARDALAFLLTSDGEDLMGRCSCSEEGSGKGKRKREEADEGEGGAERGDGEGVWEGSEGGDDASREEAGGSPVEELEIGDDDTDGEGFFITSRSPRTDRC